MYYILFFANIELVLSIWCGQDEQSSECHLNKSTWNALNTSVVYFVIDLEQPPRYQFKELQVNFVKSKMLMMMMYLFYVFICVALNQIAKTLSLQWFGTMLYLGCQMVNIVVWTKHYYQDINSLHVEWVRHGINVWSPLVTCVQTPDRPIEHWHEKYEHNSWAAWWRFFVK